MKHNLGSKNVLIVVFSRYGCQRINFIIIYLLFNLILEIKQNIVRGIQNDSISVRRVTSHMTYFVSEN